MGIAFSWLSPASRVTCPLLDSDVVVASCDRFTVFLNLNCVAIQNPDRDFLSAEFDRSVRRRNPSFECRLLRFVIYHHFDISLLQRLDRDLIWSLRFSRFLSARHARQFLRTHWFG